MAQYVNQLNACSRKASIFETTWSTNSKDVRFQVHRAASMKMIAFWDIVLCRFKID
jgi:hypothetical protein